MENKHLISHFKIFAIGHKLSLKSTQPVAMEISKALIADSNFIQDIKLYAGVYPTITTTIYWKERANIDRFLELVSVRKILETEMNSIK